ncbi:lysophospholipid acyltransferase family protein [Ferroacidibacillus organovorans]|uniref:1-acyl-sn-glycerol-3-phosphate acyltransferase n=1 Tax=Ferroacidibacillus organovorans TaxID=1765683 RepID=A0A853KE63_9BACL|nr:lysophospholipid acyltransferase family protein [Ferroacidibacillus organovorans]KYP80482.1 hypothetical protein AYJ22_02210 [Ferroacidibacillus organovorans]OAG94711.1 hypothetical protein AYW79_03980 [Ferroacidibacillus organovorans]
MTVYQFARDFMRYVVILLFQIRVTGQEHLPDQGAVLLCSTHKSNWDPVLVGCFSKREVAFLAKEELFSLKWLGHIMHKLHAFPIRRGAGDRGALRTSLQILEQGEVLVMFPEGTRKLKGQLTELQPGASMLALRSDAQIVPVAIRGHYLPFGGLRMQFGAPFQLDEQAKSLKGRAAISHATEIIATKMRELAREVEQG